MDRLPSVYISASIVHVLPLVQFVLNDVSSLCTIIIYCQDSWTDRLPNVYITASIFLSCILNLNYTLSQFARARTGGDKSRESILTRLVF